MEPITYLEAIRQGLWEEMERDPAVFLLGEDIAVYGGAFKITKGFLEKFGEDRVIDTPLSESAIVGASIGAALMGMRPVAEMQFADFISCGFDQIVNMAAKYHYRVGTPVPMVIRAPYGGRLHAGPFPLATWPARRFPIALGPVPIAASRPLPIGGRPAGRVRRRQVRDSPALNELKLRCREHT